jgi:hypothetical protein
MTSRSKWTGTLSCPVSRWAYKIGELKLTELRAYATQGLGPQFDIRQFHDQLLANAALLMDLLKLRLKQWVAEKKNIGALKNRDATCWVRG